MLRKFTGQRLLSALCLCGDLQTSFSDFEGLWMGLSRRHPRLEDSPFPPPVEGSGFLGTLGSRVEEERQQQLNKALEILVSAHDIHTYMHA